VETEDGDSVSPLLPIRGFRSSSIFHETFFASGIMLRAFMYS